MIKITLIVIVLLLVVSTFFVFPPSMGTLPKAETEAGISEKASIKTDAGDLNIMLFSKNADNPVLLVCGVQQMQYPGGMQMVPQPQVSNYYVALDGEACGPLDEKELARLIYQGRVTKDTLCWLPGMAQWQPVSQVPAVLRVVALTPPPLIV